MLKVKKGALREALSEVEQVMAPTQPPALTEVVKHIEEPAEARPPESWQMLLAKALVSMPPEVLAKVVGCIPREVLIEVIKAKESDPVVKLALVLLNAQRQA